MERDNIHFYSATTDHFSCSEPILSFDSEIHQETMFEDAYTTKLLTLCCIILFILSCFSSGDHSEAKDLLNWKLALTSKANLLCPLGIMILILVKQSFPSLLYYVMNPYLWPILISKILAFIFKAHFQVSTLLHFQVSSISTLVTPNFMD